MIPKDFITLHILAEEDTDDGRTIARYVKCHVRAYDIISVEEPVSIVAEHHSEVYLDSRKETAMCLETPEEILDMIWRSEL